MHSNPLWSFTRLSHALEPLQTECFETKNKSEDEIGRYTPSDWSKSQKEAQETGWARVSFALLFKTFLTKPQNKKLERNSPSTPKYNRDHGGTERPVD